MFPPDYFVWNGIEFYCIIGTDDPYYCGLRARVSNFVKENVKAKENGADFNKKSNQTAINYQSPLPHPMMWHARSYDSGMGN